MNWISVRKRLPRLTKARKQPNSFGVLVLIWPRFESPDATPSPIAFYGCRQTDKPNFYIYGHIIHDVTEGRRYALA